ncbi:hypothetical protein [Conexibacter woesei]|uniref:hypothetical protein n=1 Tax=Conexibacter woesei TaxID=191495 RepID=UPI00047BD2D8|nr:hypothetical protein [Conexibacter woesei]
MTSEELRLADQPDADALLKRFYDFYDGLVVGFTLEHLDGRATEPVARIRVEARADDGTWALLAFKVSGVTSFLFGESPRVSNVVLSLGIGIHFRADGIFIDLSPWNERPWTEEDVRKSHQYVAGRECTVEIHDLDPTDPAHTPDH